MHLCLSDLLDQDISSQEYFNTLSNNVRVRLLEDDDIKTFNELQEKAKKYSQEVKNLHNR